MIAPIFLFVAHAGALEAKAVLLAATLRLAFGPTYPLHAALPEGEKPVSADARALFAALGVRFHRTANPIGPDYPYGNKIGALGAMEGPCILLDSDVIALRPFLHHWSLLAADAAAKPADRATFDDAGGSWRAAYGLFGFSVPARHMLATETGAAMAPYYNAGFVFARDAGAAGRMWVDTARTIDAAPSVRAKRPWLDQIALPIAFERLGWTVSPADRRLNYPGHIRGDDGSKPYLMHYHDPAAIPRFAEARLMLARALDAFAPLRTVLAVQSEWATALAAADG